MLLKDNFRIVAMAFLLGLSRIVVAQGFYNVTSFGAKNDGSEKATQAIKQAIEAASEAGGGTVFFPAGDYITGPIYLKSHITLHLDAGAYVRFSDNFDDYLPFVQSRYEGLMTRSFSPLIYAYEEENIAITGRGTLDGQGREWWLQAERLGGDMERLNGYHERYQKENQDTLNQYSPFQAKKGFLRPPFIQPFFCKNVRIEGVTIVNSPFWTVTPEFCENVTISQVTINNPPSPNTDGINPSSCSNVHISDCHISVGDDCITIKSGKNESGRMMARPASNYTITNCTMLSGHGGVVIGSEMSGGVQKITISNCVFDGTDRGIRIKSTRGRGGIVEDIRVDNVIMKNIKKEAIRLNMFYAQVPEEPVSERTPVFRNIHFSNISAEANVAVELIGLPEMPIDHISFSDMTFTSNEGIRVTHARKIELDHVEVNTATGPALEVTNSHDIQVYGLKTYTHHAGQATVLFHNVEKAFLFGNRATDGTGVFLQVDGEGSDEILLQGNFLLSAQKAIEKSSEVKGKIEDKE